MLFRMERVFMFYMSFFLEEDNALLQERYGRAETKEERSDLFVQIVINDGTIAANERAAKFLGDFWHRRYELTRASRKQ